MFFFLIFIILVLATYILLNLFIPHKLPWYRPHLILSKSEMTEIQQTSSIPKQPVMMEGLFEPEDDLKPSAKDQIERLESILLDKNKSIEQLRKELLIEKEKRVGFEKLQMILNKEIDNLKIKNRKLKEKIGEEHE